MPPLKKAKTLASVRQKFRDPALLDERSAVSLLLDHPQLLGAFLATAKYNPQVLGQQLAAQLSTATALAWLKGLSELLTRIECLERQAGGSLTKAAAEQSVSGLLPTVEDICRFLEVLLDAKFLDLGFLEGGDDAVGVLKGLKKAVERSERYVEVAGKLAPLVGGLLSTKIRPVDEEGEFAFFEVAV